MRTTFLCKRNQSFEALLKFKLDNWYLNWFWYAFWITYWAWIRKSKSKVLQILIITRSVDSHYFQFVFAIPALVSLCRLIDLITLFPIDTPASQFLRNRPEAARRVKSLFIQDH